MAERIILLGFALGFTAPLAAGDLAKAPAVPVNELSLEVTALQTIHQFQFTYAQMKQISQWAKQTPEKGRERQEGQASEEFKSKLAELRAALVSGADLDLIEELSDEIEDLRFEEKPFLDDDVKLTVQARRHAPELLRLLKTNQYAAYAGLLIDVVDPEDFLLEALSRVRALKGADWRAKRSKIAAEIARLVGGVDEAKEKKTNRAVAALLTKARKSQDFESERAELENAARAIVGGLSPADIVRNEIEYSLAELLSNGRLAAALKARLEL